MYLAVDPDVFVASLKSDECQRAIQWMFDNSAGLRFVLDKENNLSTEYLDFMQKNPKDLSAVLFLDQLLNYKESKILRVSSTYNDDIRDLLSRRGCTTPVEPVLIGMSTQAPRRGLNILLTEPPGVRERGLFRTEIRNEFCKVIKKLRVVFASDTEIRFPALEESEKKTPLGRWFEDKARVTIREFLAYSHCRTGTPAVIHKRIGDVDFYCYETDGNPRQICIGECKLREVNEEKLIQKCAIEQLERRVPEVLDYEQKKNEFSQAPINVKGFIISNAVDMTEEAWEYVTRLKTEKNLEVRFLRTRLSDDWQVQDTWTIIEVQEFIACFDGKWKGNCIRIFPTVDY